MLTRIPSFVLAALVFFQPPLSAQTPSPTPAARPTLPAAPPDVAAPPADAEKTPSGLRHKLIAAGTGTVKPGPIDQVTVNYTGWTSDGKAFDSSVVRGRSSTLFVSRVIPGWVEGLQLMAVGETRRFWVPESLAFGVPQPHAVSSASAAFFVRLERPAPTVFSADGSSRFEGLIEIRGSFLVSVATVRGVCSRAGHRSRSHGGHDGPAEIVRRRYHAGLRNFFKLYEPLASTWAVYDASGPIPRLIAERLGIQPVKVYDQSRDLAI